ncbi:MAG: hypothetical protein ACHP6H_06220, partial [Legionellales bacterium]
EIAGISRATYYRQKKIIKNLDKGIVPPSKKPKKLNKPKWGEAEKQLGLSTSLIPIFLVAYYTHNMRCS